MAKQKLLQKYKSQIDQERFTEIIKTIETWCNKIQRTEIKIGYFTRTSTKEIQVFIKPNYKNRLDGYLLTGLIIRFSELNITLDHIDLDEVYSQKIREIEKLYVLKFSGTSLGKFYNSVYTIQNEITGHALFPPKITHY